MSVNTTSRIPKLTKHKATGQAVVRLNGKDHYLGQYGSAAASQKYEQLIAEWLAGGRQPFDAVDTEPTLNDVILAYWRRCKEYYRDRHGRPTGELELVKLACRPLKELYGRTPARKFGPLALKAVRQKLIESNLSRGYVNSSIGRLKRMFKWAVENELVPLSLFHGLTAVTGLRRGRSAARETEPVKPVPEAFVAAALPHVGRHVRAMIDLQLLTACRPGEVCIMRGCDLETSGRVWVYRPESHKTEHHGHTREIYIGPKAQEIIKPFLKLDTSAYLFSPEEAEKARGAKRRANRVTPLYPSHLRLQEKKRKRNRKRQPGNCYTVASYRRAIYRGCALAFPLPEHLAPKMKPDGTLETKKVWQAQLTPEEKAAVRAWRRNHSWHPHQLRHNAATNLRREYGVELARIILGHATAFTTEIYAEADRSQAMEVIGRVG
jgi:integrase